MAAERRRIPDDHVDALVEAFVVTASREGRLITLLDVEATLAARTGPQLSHKPTASQILDSIRRLIEAGEIVDTHEPGKPGSKHFLIPPRSSTKGFFE